MPKLIRITTAPLSLKYLLSGQMRYMNEHGFEVVMVSSEGPEREEVIQTEGCRHEIIPMTRKITPVADLKALWLLYRLFKKEKPDIVHSHTPKAGLLAMLAARMAGIKLRIHTIAGLRFMTAKGNTRKILVAMEKLTAKAANHVWPNSFSLRDYIIQNKLVSPAKMEVIGLGSSNGIRLTRFSEAALNQDKLNDIKKSIGFDPSLLYFVSVGRIVHDKGIDELVNAFVEVNKKFPNTRLVLVGTFEDELDPISDTARNILHSHKDIIQAGWSDAVEYYMQFAFALIHPSHREGFPNVLLQAGAMRCPIICSRIEGNIDIVDDGLTGLIFPVRDAAALQQKMEHAIRNPTLLTTYATALREKIEKHFDQPVVHLQLEQRYIQLLNNIKR
jgi:glycosyltransferase involved in cell wall biosynthesis